MDEIEKLGSRRLSSGGGEGGIMRSVSRSRSNWGVDDVSSGSTSRRTGDAADDEEALTWAAIEKLPTYDRLRTSIITHFVEGDGAGKLKKEVDVTKLGEAERQQFIDRLFRVAEEDNEAFLKKFRQRIDKVGIRLPTVEVRFQNLTIEADGYIGSRALPTLLNVTRNIGESLLGLIG